MIILLFLLLFSSFFMIAAIGGWERDYSISKMTKLSPEDRKRVKARKEAQLSTGDPRYSVNLKDDEEWKNLTKE